MLDKVASTICVGLLINLAALLLKYNTVLGLVVVVRQNSSNALLLGNIQLTEENSLPGIFMTLIVRMPDLKLFFWLPFY